MLNQNKQKQLEVLPLFESDAAAEKFVDEADLTQYDLSGFKPKLHLTFSITKLLP